MVSILWVCELWGQRVIRIRKALAGKSEDFQGFHLFGVVIVDMVVTQQMEYAVDDHMRPVRFHGFVLFGASRRTTSAQITISPSSGAMASSGRPSGMSKGKDSTLVGLSLPR